jgi:xanthosine utilization system XapX-like protein
MIILTIAQLKILQGKLEVRMSTSRLVSTAPPTLSLLCLLGVWEGNDKY